MLTRWWFSGVLRNCMSSGTMASNGNRASFWLPSLGLRDYGHSCLPCTSSSSSYRASYFIPPINSIFSILSKTLSTSSPPSESTADDAIHSPYLVSNDNPKERDPITLEVTKKPTRLLNVEELKKKLGMEEGKEVIGYNELLEACKSVGVSKSPGEAAAFARVLDEAGIILLFRDKVYLHPDKIVDLVRKAVPLPLALTPEDDPIREELKKLQAMKQEIDALAHKQVRCILWSGLGFTVLHIGLLFRLTFWDLSWDIMEPITFFCASAGLVIGYAYFLFTSRDPSYEDVMQRLFCSRQKRLMKRHNFNLDRFTELQRRCRSPIDASR
ncbi:hypothetical protein SAY87_024719 [Trapa incisa]|uniref:Calcium uniporter protein C-terminal domain-containing protein n=1 Tax=Trapa incisa TaxID=236973 RepID=A0AAN7GA21_9MYRT|nr:hypothetical protein SAY87_024719 [Trapa incisa]